MMCMKTVRLAILVLPAVIGVVHGGPRDDQYVCQNGFLDGFFTTVSTAIINIDHAPSPPDILGNTSYFTDIIQFTDAELTEFTVNAKQFYLDRFGLDFFSVTPDPESGLLIYENAIFVPWTNDPTFAFSYVANADPFLVSDYPGFVPEYYAIRTGGYFVVFQGLQTLRGSWGGEDGIVVGQIPNQQLIYGHLYCESCPNGPLVLPFQTQNPTEIEPIDGTVYLNLYVQHPELGDGVGRGFFRIEPSDDPLLLLYQYRLVITFDGLRLRCG